MAAFFADVADRLKVGITLIMTWHNVTGTVIDEGVYDEFEQNHPVGTLVLESECSPGFWKTPVQRNQFLSIFGNAATTIHELNVAETAQPNTSVTRWHPSEVL